MPLINSNPTSFDREIQLLEAAGITAEKKKPVEERFFDEMLKGGLTPEEIVSTLSAIMNSGENSSVKLAAAKMGLSMYMHPAFVPRKEAETKQMPVINISIAGGNVQLNQVLRPVENTIIDI